MSIKPNCPKCQKIMREHQKPSNSLKCFNYCSYYTPYWTHHWKNSKEYYCDQCGLAIDIVTDRVPKMKALEIVSDLKCPFCSGKTYKTRAYEESFRETFVTGPLEYFWSWFDTQDVYCKRCKHFYLIRECDLEYRKKYTKENLLENEQTIKKLRQANISIRKAHCA